MMDQNSGSADFVPGNRLIPGSVRSVEDLGAALRKHVEQTCYSVGRQNWPPEAISIENFKLISEAVAWSGCRASVHVFGAHHRANRGHRTRRWIDRDTRTRIRDLDKTGSIGVVIAGYVLTWLIERLVDALWWWFTSDPENKVAATSIAAGLPGISGAEISDDGPE